MQKEAAQGNRRTDFLNRGICNDDIYGGLRLNTRMANSPSVSLRVVRTLSWVAAGLPLIFFIVVCTMAADSRGAVGAEGGTWQHTLQYACANIAKATFWPPLIWVLLVAFTQQTREKTIAQAVLLTGGCGILILFWGTAMKIVMGGA